MGVYLVRQCVHQSLNWAVRKEVMRIEDVCENVVGLHAFPNEKSKEVGQG